VVMSISEEVIDELRAVCKRANSGKLDKSVSSSMRKLNNLVWAEPSQRSAPDIEAAARNFSNGYLESVRARLGRKRPSNIDHVLKQLDLLMKNRGVLVILQRRAPGQQSSDGQKRYVQTMNRLDGRISQTTNYIRKRTGEYPDIANLLDRLLRDHLTVQYSIGETQSIASSSRLDASGTQAGGPSHTPDRLSNSVAGPSRLRRSAEEAGRKRRKLSSSAPRTPAGLMGPASGYAGQGSDPRYPGFESFAPAPHWPSQNPPPLMPTPAGLMGPASGYAGQGSDPRYPGFESFAPAPHWPLQNPPPLMPTPAGLMGPASGYAGQGSDPRYPGFESFAPAPHWPSQNPPLHTLHMPTPVAHQRPSWLPGPPAPAPAGTPYLDFSIPSPGGPQSGSNHSSPTPPRPLSPAVWDERPQTRTTATGPSFSNQYGAPSGAIAASTQWTPGESSGSAAHPFSISRRTGRTGRGG